MDTGHKRLNNNNYKANHKQTRLSKEPKHMSNLTIRVRPNNSPTQVVGPRTNFFLKGPPSHPCKLPREGFWKGKVLSYHVSTHYPHKLRYEFIWKHVSLTSQTQETGFPHIHRRGRHAQHLLPRFTPYLLPFPFRPQQPPR